MISFDSVLVLVSCIITSQVQGYTTIHEMINSNGGSDDRTESIFQTKTSSLTGPYKSSYQKRDVSERYCESGWHSFGEMCYKFEGTNRGESISWHGAEQFCVKEGGNLASIHSAELNDFLMTNVRMRVWIGFHDRQKETEFKWTDETSVDFKNWASKQPSRIYGNIEEDCVEMYYSYDGDHNGMWNDVDCNALRPFICQKIKDNPCLPTMDNSCNNNGNCEERNDKNGYKCKCNELFSGKSCEHDGGNDNFLAASIISSIIFTVGVVSVVIIIAAAFTFRRWEREKRRGLDYIGLQPEI